MAPIAQDTAIPARGEREPAMPPMFDGTADTNSWQQPTGLLARLLSIPTEFRVAILSAILLAEVVVAAYLGAFA